MAWIKGELAGPRANGTWTILYGHHPLYSNGDHGDASRASQPLGAWLQASVCESGHVDLVLNGHDHDLQWLVAKPDTYGTTEFVVSGAGAKTRPITDTPNDAHFACGDTLGYAWFEIHGERLTGRLFNGDGGLMFERTLDRATGNATATTHNGAMGTCSTGG